MSNKSYKDFTKAYLKDLEDSNEEDPLLRYLTKDTLTGSYDTSMEPTSIS